MVEHNGESMFRIATYRTASTIPVSRKSTRNVQGRKKPVLSMHLENFVLGFVEGLLLGVAEGDEETLFFLGGGGGDFVTDTHHTELFPLSASSPAHSAHVRGALSYASAGLDVISSIRGEPNRLPAAG